MSAPVLPPSGPAAVPSNLVLKSGSAAGSSAPEASPRPQPRDDGRIEGLDLLRLFAALSVVVFHYAWRGAVGGDLTRISIPALAPVAKYGFLGVDLFFVISGFVIARSAEGRTWRQFSLARFARIYPAFLVCMTATFALILLLGRPRFETSLAQWAANLLIVSPAAGVPFMDGAYWSIVYEVVFYGWMALFIAGGVFPKHARLLVVAWLAASMANELALDSYYVRRLLLTDHSGFFAAGVALYLLRGGGRDVATWALFAGSTLVAACQLPMTADWMRVHLQVAVDNTVLVSCAVGSIALVAVGTGVRSVKLRPGLVAAIGGLTYPLYLLHQNAGYVVFNRLEGVLPAPAVIVLTASLMMAAAWLVWRFVEPAGRRAIHRLSARAGNRTMHGTSRAQFQITPK